MFLCELVAQSAATAGEGIYEDNHHCLLQQQVMRFNCITYVRCIVNDADAIYMNWPHVDMTVGSR